MFLQWLHQDLVKIINHNMLSNLFNFIYSRDLTFLFLFIYTVDKGLLYI